MRIARLLPWIVVVTLAGCGDTIINVPTAPTPPPAAPVVPVADVIQFRVDGNAASVRIRQSDPLNGLSQLTTTLPYVAGFSSTQPFAFLSIEATPATYPLTVTSPFLSVQIVVNGTVFREASSVDRTATIAVSGTYRR
jgi:hypothetical protein